MREVIGQSVFLTPGKSQETEVSFLKAAFVILGLSPWALETDKTDSK